MNEFTLFLRDEELAVLKELLEQALRETRIEEHRTRTPSYRQGVIRREEIILDMLKKLPANNEAAAVN